MDTPRYKQLQEKYNAQTDEKSRIDTLIDMGVEIRNFDVDQASEMADEIL
ncbi:MAG: hypothetical protein JSS96_15360, partial [Bacteroidetes bacterium]|nr:hypothetical protein [Bacteroidota bacterium]